MVDRGVGSASERFEV
jgi:hypothetical protein